ncbi:MAG: hypothetical protein LIP02_00210 [Bacteroidales bacterium]|nr:hypothetical protein [Bacteroidales bacterium]
MKRFITFFALLITVALTAVTLTACGDDDDDDNTVQTWNYSIGLADADGSEALEVLEFFDEKIPAALGVTHNVSYFQLTGTYAECRTKIANAFASLYTEVNAQGWTGYYTVQVTCMNNSQVVILYTINH